MKVTDERGETMLEFALIAPALMLLILGVLQFGLWFHAQHVVQTAALEASRVAAAENGTIHLGEERAIEVVSAGLGRAASSPEVQVVQESETVSVDVETSMRGLLPIPGLTSIDLRSTAISYREEFRTQER